MTQQNIAAANSSRIIALDHLRVIAVVILFLYHLGMIWVPDWHFHYKQDSNWIWLQHVMMLSSPWRMGLLWFISGTSLYAMQKKWGSVFLLTNRSNAILLPLFFGILFVVPVQLFVEMTQKGVISTSFQAFLVHFYFGSNSYFDGFSAGIWHHIDVNHLWFLRSLWRFMFVLVILQYPLGQLHRRHNTFNVKWLSVLIAISLIISNLDNSDLKRDLYGFTCLLFGYLFGVSAQFWQWLKQQFKIIIIAAGCLVVAYQLGFWLDYQQTGDDLILYLAVLAYNVSKIVSLIAILAIANRLFSKPSALISDANRYVFPLYVIHQSVLIVIAFLIASLELSAMFSLLLTLLFSTLICLLLLLICKYNALAGMLVGKRPRVDSSLHSKVAQAVITLLTLPLAIELLDLW